MHCYQKIIIFSYYLSVALEYLLWPSLQKKKKTKQTYKLQVNQILCDTEI